MGDLDILVEVGIGVGMITEDGKTTVASLVPGTQQLMVQGKLAMAIDNRTEIMVMGKTMEVETVIGKEVEAP